MKYEKPQKGNPRELTIKQHTFPAASIVRFAGGDGNVKVFLLAQRKEISVKSDNKIFCAMRSWDQRAEAGFMKEIEDKYQELAEGVIPGTVTILKNEHQKIVTDMFAIWNIRHHRKNNPISDYKIEGVMETLKKTS